MKKILIPISMLLITHSAYAQLTQKENYIQSKTYLDYNTAGNPVKTSETVQYFDGLGRPKQIVNVKASPQEKDVVTHIEYDQFGRQIKDYLPVPQSGTLNGAIIPNPLSSASSSPYGSEKIYSEKVLENSPLDKVQQQIQTGNDWSSKPIKFDYETNINGEVKKYVATFNYSTFEANIVLSGTYEGSQLYKNTVTDQDGNKTIEFKNGKGQILLARKVISETENADTYYVYNNYQQLAYVIPPLASVSPVIDETILNNLCYQYKYDERKRLVEKKVPGKGWEYMVYDKSDRLVLTQDANLRTKGQWLFTKYDQFSRPIYTGILDSSPGRIQQKNAIEGHGTNYETKSVSSWNNSGMDVFYTNNGAYPTSNFKILSVNYYDTYPSYSFNPPFPSTIQGIETLKETVSAEGRSTKGLPVMSLIKNIEDDNWTKNYNYYDIKGRVIGSYSINHLGGYTKKESKLDFTGIAQTVIIRHKRLETDTEKIITENFEYDHQNRLLIHKHQVDANPVEILAQNKYNELSQLESKKVGGTDISNPLQTIDYKYNIKGRLTKINDPSNLNGKLFGYEIKYNQPINNTISPGRFNGNIAEIDWRNSSEDVLKRYNYEYDRLNRLKNGFYSEPNATNPANGNFDEYLTYDLNGNINTLQRKAPPVSGQTSALVDNLEYKYTGNRLNQVIESAMNDTGYEGGNNMIDYDANGNMTTMKDKGINSIVYNYINLPNSYSIENKSFGLTMYIGLNYLYRADGTKLRKVYSSRPVKGLTSYTTTDYLDGFQYSYREGGGICITCRTESAFEEQAYGSLGKVFPDLGETSTWKLEFVPTSEGFYSFTENRYIYQYKDHLGNARVSFAKDSAGVLEVTDTNNYYPFGLNHISGMFGLSNFGALYSYKYNGKELQETGMYDYGARMYMPDLGRWGVIDPKSQQTHEIYSYAWNNPIQFTDPTGMMAETFGVSDDWVRDNETQELRWEESAIDQSTSPAGTTYVGETFQEGNLYYAADGYVYDDSAAGKGKAIEDGRVHDVGDVIITKTNLWNSPFARFLVPDRFGITQGGSVGGGAEIGTSMGLEVITRGKDAGIYFDPGNTLSLGVAFGAGGEGNLSFFSSSFTGKVSDMNLNSVVGTEAYVNGSLVDVVGVTGSVSVSFDPKNPFAGDRWVTRSVGVAAGAKGSVGAGVTISNTRVGVGFDGKIRIADYTGAVTGKGSY